MVVNINAQEWLSNRYPNKEELKIIEVDEASLVGQLKIENFPQLEKINVKGSWNNWGRLTSLTIKNCPNLTELDCSYNEITEVVIANCPKLHKLDCSFNSQWEELAKFDGSKLDYSVVSYIGSLDSELYEQLKTSLPGSKHEDIGRLCFGCLADGGHGNKPDYNYHAEVELTKGGIIEYAVATTGNKRETCEVPEGGGLLVVDINSTDGGTIKIKRREVSQSQDSETTGEVATSQPFSSEIWQAKEAQIADLKAQILSLQKQAGEEGAKVAQNEFNLNKKQKNLDELEQEINKFQNEREKLAETIQKLDDKLKEVSDEQWRKQLKEGKVELEEKLAKIQQKLTESEQQRQELKTETNELMNKLTQLESQKNSELEKNKQLATELLEEKDKQIKELQNSNNSLTEKITELEKIIEDLQVHQFDREKLSLAQTEEVETVLSPTQIQDDISLFSTSSSEKPESEEKILKKKYPGLARLLGEAKGKLSSDNYKWLIKVFEAQEELIYLENQDSSKLKSSHHHQEISETKWKLRNFQSKLKKEGLSDVFAKSKELIEKQIKSQKSSSAKPWVSVNKFGSNACRVMKVN